MLLSGFLSYLENLEKLEFCHFFSRSGKCWICSKSSKNQEFQLKIWKNVKFANSMFQASIFKMLSTKIILIYFFVISSLSAQTLIWSQIDLRFYCFYLEITLKIHEILCQKRNGNPVLWIECNEIFVVFAESPWASLLSWPQLWGDSAGQDFPCQESPMYRMQTTILVCSAFNN